jgi:hypothetical protein
MRYDEPRRVWTRLTDHHTLVNAGEGIVCEKRVARRRGARARRSVRANPIPNPDPNPSQAPQMSLKES